MAIQSANPVVKHYDHCAEVVKDDARAMGWSSKFNQLLRFQVFNYLIDFTGGNLLDVGCGDGALFHYCLDQNIALDYKGIDISSKMVQRAQHRYPGISVRQCDFFEYDLNHNIVVCSGGLSICEDQDPMTYLNSAIDTLFRISNEHLVFNLLSDVTPNKDPLFNYYSPMAVLDLCLKKTHYVTLHHSYLPNDFTVHLIKA